MAKKTRSEARRSLIDTYRIVAHHNDQVADELRDRADQFEEEEMGHECGHIFTLSFNSIIHSGIAGEGPESHRDGKLVMGTNRTVQVRAHNLRDALRKAASLPLDSWRGQEEAPYIDDLAGDRGAGSPA